MPKVTPDPEWTRDIARRLSKAHPQAERELRRFVAGEVIVADALPALRAVIREMVTPTKWPANKWRVSNRLRADVHAWAVKYGTGREPRNGGEATTHNVSQRWTATELDGIDRAAKRAGLNRSEYIRQAVNVQVERDLGATVAA